MCIISLAGIDELSQRHLTLMALSSSSGVVGSMSESRDGGISAIGRPELGRSKEMTSFFRRSSLSWSAELACSILTRFVSTFSNFFRASRIVWTLLGGLIPAFQEHFIHINCNLLGTSYNFGCKKKPAYATSVQTICVPLIMLA